MFEENLNQIEEKVSRACSKVGRSTNEVQVIAVTKSVTSELARNVVELGITHLAENRVDKLLEKQHALADCSKIVWHLIGNLQRRKVKTIINEIDYFHALDSLKLAEEIHKRAAHPIKCFVEVNVSGEESKQGITIEELPDFIHKLEQFPKVLVVGLMTMAPIDATHDEIKKYFDALCVEKVKIEKQKRPSVPCTELSMGMSQDYPLAIESGATFVRIGTAFFQTDH